MLNKWVLLQFAGYGLTLFGILSVMFNTLSPADKDFLNVNVFSKPWGIVSIFIGILAIIFCGYKFRAEKKNL